MSGPRQPARDHVPPCHVTKLPHCPPAGEVPSVETDKSSNHVAVILGQAGNVASPSTIAYRVRVDGTDEGDARSDADVLAAVRAGDDAAYAELWTRHSTAARRLAATFVQPANVDDLVSESYYRVPRAVRTGGGPQGAFRPYLFSTMRRLAIDTSRSYDHRVTLTDQPSDLESEPASSAADVSAVSADERAAWRAWASLPEASRTVLWHVLVEEQTPAAVAPILGTSPNGVALRAGRAKERLRQAFLQQHLAAADNAECRETRGRLGGYVRGALSARDRAAVDEHLRSCERCRARAAGGRGRQPNPAYGDRANHPPLGGAVVAQQYLPAAGAVAAGAATAGGARWAPPGCPGFATLEPRRSQRREPRLLP
jgi:RNA polymerase sigma factor (sigma-70 family)